MQAHPVDAEFVRKNSGSHPRIAAKLRHLVGIPALLAGVLLLPGVADAKTWYVDSDAKLGLNSGSNWTDAWKEMDQIGWNLIKPGDVICISGGTYITPLRAQASGTPDQPIVIKASQDPGHNGPIVHNNTIGAYGNGNCLIFDGARTEGFASNIRSTFQVKSAVPSNCNWTTQGGVFNGIGGCTNITLRWIAFSNLGVANAGNGLVWNNGYLEQNVVEYCYFHDIEWAGVEVSEKNGEPSHWDYSNLVLRWSYMTNTGDDFYEGQAGATINNNFIESQSTRRGHPDGIAGHMGKQRIYNNIFVDVWDQILYLKVWESVPDRKDVYIYGNLFYVDKGASPPKKDGIQTVVSIGWETGRTGVPPSNRIDNVVIANNTFIADGTTDPGKIMQFVTLVNAYAGANTTYLSKWVIANNVFYKSPQVAVSLKGGVGDGFAYSPTDVILKNNVIYATTPDGRSIIYRGTRYADAQELALGTGYVNFMDLPQFVSIEGRNFAPHLVDTSLVDRAMDLSPLGLPGWDRDLNGNPRLGDSRPDIGAIELTDPSMLVRIRFDDDPADGRLLDSTGNGRDVLRFGKPGSSYPSNAIQTIAASAASGGGQGDMGNAGVFRWQTNDWGMYLKSGSYGGITNRMGSLTNMPVATIALWAKYDSFTNVIGAKDWSADGNATLLGTSRSTGVNGTWSLGRFNSYNSRNQTRFLVMTNNLIEPSNQWIDFPDMPVNNLTGDTGGWHHYAVVWDNGRCSAYFDGDLVGTKDWSAGTTSLRIAQNSPAIGPWIGVGCDPHGGTPELEDEAGEDYPNHGWFNGKMDDLRIYNRALSAKEIEAMAKGYASRPGSPGRLTQGPKIP